MRKLIVKTDTGSQSTTDGAPETSRPVRIFSLNPDRFPERRRTSHLIPPWIRVEDEFYFITVNCMERDRNQFCKPDIAGAIFSALDFYAARQLMFPGLVLLMPDHLHGIFAFPRESGIRKTISTFKKYLARTQRLNFQDGFFEHRIRSHEHLLQIEEYILKNPVRKNLVCAPGQWDYIYRPDIRSDQAEQDSRFG